MLADATGPLAGAQSSPYHVGVGLGERAWAAAADLRGAAACRQCCASPLQSPWAASCASRWHRQLQQGWGWLARRGPAQQLLRTTTRGGGSCSSCGMRACAWRPPRWARTVLPGTAPGMAPAPTQHPCLQLPTPSQSAARRCVMQRRAGKACVHARGRAGQCSQLLLGGCGALTSVRTQQQPCRTPPHTATTPALRPPRRPPCPGCSRPSTRGRPSWASA